MLLIVFYFFSLPYKYAAGDLDEYIQTTTKFVDPKNVKEMKLISLIISFY